MAGVGRGQRNVELPAVAKLLALFFFTMKKGIGSNLIKLMSNILDDLFVVYKTLYSHQKSPLPVVRRICTKARLKWWITGKDWTTRMLAKKNFMKDKKMKLGKERQIKKKKLFFFFCCKDVRMNKMARFSPIFLVISVLSCALLLFWGVCDVGQLVEEEPSGSRQNVK